MGVPETLPANFDGFDKAPATLPADFNQWDQPKKPSAASRLGTNFLSGLGVTSDEEAKNFFGHPLDTVIKSFEAQGQLAKKARDAYQRGDYMEALQHGLNYLVPFVGQQTDQAGTQLKEGDIAGGIGRTLGAAVPIVAGSPEARAAGSAAVDTATSAVRPAFKTIGKTATAVGQSLDPDVVGLVSPRAAHALRLSQKVGRIATKFGGEAAPVPSPTESPEPVYPGASLPANPLPEQINPALASPARTLPGMHTPEVTRPPAPVAAPPAQPIPARPGLQLSGEVAAPAREARSIVVDPATGRPEFSDALAAKQAEVSTPTKTTAVDLEKQLNDALGGKPLQRGVSLKNQIKSAVQSQTKLPEGFTPVDSSALKGYKYNPDAHEFESITTNGQRYVHGDVSPDQAAAFEAADSKGKAWNDLRSSSPLVAKVVDGRRVAAKPPVGMRSIVIDPQTGQPEFSDVVEAKKSASKTAATPKTPKPAVSAAPDDLSAILQESLKRARATRAAK